MSGVIGVVVFVAFYAAILFGGRYLLLLFSILTANKEALHEVGNMCEKEKPGRYLPKGGHYDWHGRWQWDDDWRRRGEG